ncbi:MAG: hypothetical protein IJ134_04410 [Bacilli bacterium]|nr:hypothetical protein [Bacilli bacterium]
MEKKKKITLPIKVTIVGCLIGLVVAGIGVFKQLDSKRINEERHDEALKQSQAMVDKANERLAEIEKEYNEIKAQYDAKNQECNADKTNFSDPNWFNNQSNCNQELFELNSKMSDLELEDSSIKAKDYTVYYDEVKPMSYYIFYIIGGSIAGLAILGAFIIYLVKGEKRY